MTQQSLKPRQLRSHLQGARGFYRAPETKMALVRAGVAGLVLGITLFVGALFAAAPAAPPARVLGVDERIIGIPRNCDEANAAQIAPMARGTGFYNPRLDGDRDGLACEAKRFWLF